MSDTIVQNDLDFSNRLALEQLDKLSYDRIMSKPVQDALKAAKSALGEVARVAWIREGDRCLTGTATTTAVVTDRPEPSST